MTLLTKIKTAINGKKTYIAGSIAIIATLLAWAAGELSLAMTATAIFIELEGMFLRAGVAKTTQDKDFIDG